MSDLQIERRKFEEWAKETGHPEGGYRLETISSGAYINPETRCAWRGWIGRAQLAAPVLTECRHCGFRVALNEAPQDAQPAQGESQPARVSPHPSEVEMWERGRALFHDRGQ